MGMNMIQSSCATCLLCGVILTATVFYQPVGACVRSARSNPSKDQEEVSVGITTTTELPSYIETFNCTINQTREKSCRNRARCYSNVNTEDDSFTLVCHCDGKYTGDRCQSIRKPNPVIDTTSPPSVIPASTIAVAVVAVVVALVIVIVVVLVCKLRKHDPQNGANRRLGSQLQSQRLSTNGTANGSGEGHVNTKIPEEAGLMEIVKIENNNTGPFGV